MLSLFVFAPACWCAVVATPAPLPTRIDAQVHGTLERTLQEQAPEAGRALAAQVARLLHWRGDIRRLVQPGDRLQLLFSPDDAGGEPSLQAAVYVGARVGLQAYRFVAADGVGRYYDESGTRIEPVMRNSPVPRYEQITEVVQHGRGRRRHRGDDLKAPQGAQVVLPFPGRVSRVNWHRRRNGLCVQVQLDAGYTANFLHLSSVSDAVKRGHQLAAGAPLGEVGSTGRSNAPHLHYELLRNGRPVEPLAVHGHAQAGLAGAELTRFVSAREVWRQALGLDASAAPAEAAAASSASAMRSASPPPQ